MPSNSPAKPRTKQDYEELGRRLENIYITGYISKKEMFKMSLLKGVLAGFGGVIGATIVVALLAWTLSLFDTTPLVGPIFDNLKDTVNTQR
jgi:hypothetical protein